MPTFLEYSVENLRFLLDIARAVQKSEENQPIAINLAMLVAEYGRLYQFCYLRVSLGKFGPRGRLEHRLQRLYSDSLSIALAC